MENVEAKVYELKKKYCTKDPFKLCEELGIMVMYFALPDHVKGFFTSAYGLKIIYINNALSDNDQRVICAHELGHALMHENINSVFITYHTNLLCSRYENEADYFCACLLLEDDYFDHNVYGFSTYEQISAFSGIDVKLVEKRGKHLKRL